MTLTYAPTPGDTSWFVHDRFGLFIHWGLYALPARHEWVKRREFISEEKYEEYFKRFDPDLYDPRKWARAAKDAGMKYFCITTKHHEGFCLWDSKLTDYKAPNTPAGRDLLLPMVEAFREEGLKVGFYHSIIDWHHPDYTLDRTHPRHTDEEALAKDKEKNWNNYVEYLHGQVRELLTEYGQVDYLFFDFSIKAGPDGLPPKGREEWQSEKLIRMIRELQPNIMINDRLDIPQDVTTPEQYIPSKPLRDEKGNLLVWEGCNTFSGAWGYHRDEESWKSVDQLVKMLIDMVGKGGNLLLNVGPTARGEFDERALDRLSGMGRWMDRHGKAIYGCGPAPEEFEVPENCRYTYNAETNRLYLHVFSWPFKFLHLHNMADRVEYAQLLNDGSEILFKKHKDAVHSGLEEKMDDSYLTLTLPVKKPAEPVPVIELFLK